MVLSTRPAAPASLGRTTLRLTRTLPQATSARC